MHNDDRDTIDAKRLGGILCLYVCSNNWVRHMPRCWTLSSSLYVLTAHKAAEVSQFGWVALEFLQKSTWYLVWASHHQPAICVCVRWWWWRRLRWWWSSESWSWEWHNISNIHDHRVVYSRAIYVQHDCMNGFTEMPVGVSKWAPKWEDYSIRISRSEYVSMKRLQVCRSQIEE